MDFKNFLSGEKKNQELYWALVLESGWVQAGIWEINNEKAEVAAISPATPWETDEELITAADTALSAAIQILPEETTEPSKTVFGVPSSWVADGQIKDEYLDKIKKICGELSLDPSGFVVLPEAVAHLKKSEEGSPLNAVVLGAGRENLEMAVFRLGNLTGVSTVARSVSIVEDVVEGLSRFMSEEPLPSRFIIYNGKEGELEEVKQSLTSAQWEDYEKIKFLHTPKIEILTPEKKVLATALAGASEIGHVSLIEEKNKIEDKEKEDNLENVVIPEPAPVPEEMGFVVGEDIASQKAIPVQEQKPATAVPISENPAVQKKLELLPFLEKVKAGFWALLAKVSPGSRLNQEGGKIFLFGGIFLLILLITGFLYWWFYPKASVVILVSPKKTEEIIELELNPNISSPDFSQKILPGEILRTQVSGEKTKSTTGTKTIGEKAKGSVKIQNGTGFPINLPAGTIILATNDLKFSLSSSASVSAALSPTTPGEASVEAVAAEIGAEYNLAKDESFKVGNYPKSEVDAVATSDFSGGSSRQISAVSEDDQETLEKELEEELIQKAESELSQNLGGDDFFIQEAVSATASSRTFSNKIGDEATNLKISLTLDVAAPLVNKEHLVDFAKEVLKDKVPSGYVLRENQLDFDFRLKGEKAGVFDLDFLITANFLPEIKSQEIIKKIAGRQPEFAEEYLTSIPGFSRAEIQIKPRFPGRLGILPKVIKNINIEIEGER
jgi:hypothetical protein